MQSVKIEIITSKNKVSGINKQNRKIHSVRSELLITLANNIDESDFK